MIAPHTQPAGGLHGLGVEDAPAPEELPLFNRTGFEQIFVPIPLGQSTVGVLHIWFQPVDEKATQARLSLLKQACGEVELYLKARRLGDVSQEVTRLSTYSRLLEELSGDLDLQSLGWNIVNYAREAVDCERVCLFIASDYGRLTTAREEGGLTSHFELLACSGLKRPHPRSEQAVILSRVAQRLTQSSLVRPLKRTGEPKTNGRKGALPQPNGHANGAVVPAEGAPPAKAEETEADRPPAPPTSSRPRLQMTLMTRDPAKVATRPAEINEYFSVMPMNWATVLPLLDREDRVCGMVLFEGTKSSEKLESTFLQMRDLAISAGRALGTALYWNKQPSIRLAHRWVRARQQFVSTPPRQKFVKYVLPALILAALLACPVPFRVKGDATILPRHQNALPALVSARLLAVEVREGERVTEGQLLARFDTHDLELQLRQAEQEYERALIESDAALNRGNELEMQVARLTAAKAEALGDKIRADLARAYVRAPFDGIVVGAQSLSLRVGQVMQLGEPLLHVVDPKDWQVKVALREQDLLYLDQRLEETGSINGRLKLAANPAKRYDLNLASQTQLAYGLDVSSGEYEFIAMIPLQLETDDPEALKAGFAGRASFEGGLRPVAYVLFRDFVNFLRVKFA